MITLTATNSVGLTSTGTVTVDVLAAPVALAIATACPLNSPTAGTSFSQTLTAIGGTGARTYSLSAGSLPAGLTLRPSGLISGTATVAGTTSFTLQVSDSDSPAQTGPKSCAMTVNAAAVAPVITAACPLPAGTVATAYTNALTATGTTPMIWTLTAGALPNALKLVRWRNDLRIAPPCGNVHVHADGDKQRGTGIQSLLVTDSGQSRGGGPHDRHRVSVTRRDGWNGLHAALFQHGRTRSPCVLLIERELASRNDATGGRCCLWHAYSCRYGDVQCSGK